MSQPNRNKTIASASFLAASILIFMIGCGGGGGSTSVSSAVDQQLLNRLTALNPMGPNAFILPDSDALALIPQDPQNPLTPEKVHLGQLLFHETAIMTEAVKTVGLESASCASCHHAGAGFQAGRFQGIGEGGVGFGQNGESRQPRSDYLPTEIDSQPIRTPSAMNGAYQPNQLWNGQFGATDANVGTQSRWTPGTPKQRNNLGFEGLETQAIAGIGVHRLFMTRQIAENLGYKEYFDQAFPHEPEDNRYTVITAGLAIAAYERTVMANRSPWQRYLRGDVKAMSENQKLGAQLFFTKAECYKCHTGPALNEKNFRAIGMRDLSDHPGVNNANFSSIENFGRGGFTGNPADNFKFKTPQLYNLKDAVFLGHGASFTSVRDIIEYKNRGVAENPRVPTNQLDPNFKPLNLNPTEVDLLTDFVLNALRDPSLNRYVPQRTMSGKPFPNNDP